MAYSQYEKRKIGTDAAALERIAKQKADIIKEDIVLSKSQYAKIRKIYKLEATKIDSLKFLSPAFYENPMRSRAVILECKHVSETQIYGILSPEQQRLWVKKKEEKRKIAFEKLQQQNKLHEVKAKKHE